MCFKMVMELSLYLLLFIFLNMVTVGHTHAVPKGFYLSNSCQPRCQSGKTCVVYRGTDNIAHVTCKSIDPHKVILDGTFIITSPNLEKDSTSFTSVNPNTANEQTIADFESLIKPLPDIGLDTATTKDTGNATPIVLFNQMKAYPDSIKDNMQNELGTIEKRPQLFNPDTFAKPADDNVSPFQHLQSSLNRKVHERKSPRQRFGDLVLVRNADGGVVFRRIGDVSNQQTVLPHQNRNVADIPEMSRSSNTNTDTNKPSQESIPPQNLLGKTPTNNTNAACKHCEPDKKCPGDEYCFYSPACAAQICQPLK